MNDEQLILAFCATTALTRRRTWRVVRLQYPGNVRVLRLPCTGKLEVNFVLAAFERLVDEVIVSGAWRTAII